MIDINSKTGMLKLAGSIETILTEYVILTSTLMEQIEEVSNEETTFKIIAKLGEIALEHIDAKIIDGVDINDKVYEVLKNEMQI